MVPGWYGEGKAATRGFSVAANVADRATAATRADRDRSPSRTRDADDRVGDQLRCHEHDVVEPALR
jgi:hypothetical protein